MLPVLKLWSGKQPMFNTLEAISASSPKKRYLYPHSTKRTASGYLALMARNCCSSGVYCLPAPCDRVLLWGESENFSDLWPPVLDRVEADEPALSDTDNLVRVGLSSPLRPVGPVGLIDADAVANLGKQTLTASDVFGFVVSSVGTMLVDCTRDERASFLCLLLLHENCLSLSGFTVPKSKVKTEK